MMLLGTGAVATKTYVDDVFSTFLYTGNGSDNRVVTNNIDLAAEGGLVWVKNRDNSTAHYLTDTVRGVSKGLRSNNSNAETTSTVDALKSFTSTGFTVGTGGNVNETNADLASWTFRKAPGFFDVVTYTASTTNIGDTQVISHSLGSIPGLIMIKRTDNIGNWIVYHRSLGNDAYVTLDEAYSANTNMNQFDKTDPTASSFTVEHTSTGSSEGQGGYADVAIPNATYVAYLFAGGEDQTTATATSVDFTNTGSGQGQVRASTSGGALEFGTGDFTIECWVKPTNLGSNLEVLFDSGNNGSNASDSVYFGYNQSEVFLKSENAYYNQASTTNYNNQWMHVAACRSGTNLRIFKNGTLLKTTTNSTDLQSGSTLFIIGKAGNINGDLTGSISNFRAIKGQALYTSSFRPSTEPLTTTSQGATASNVKLLCCQGSTPSAATVSPYTLSAYYATSSTDSPFDDPAAHVFGESGSESVVKCGSYVGNGSSTGPEINLGFEPQFVIIKASSFANQHWHLFDNMRGIVSDGDDKWLYPNLNNTEPSAAQRIDLTSTGFKLASDEEQINEDGETFVYMAIRRPDGYVGKPPELGTDVFAMDTGNSNADQAFTSGFPVDFAFNRQPATASQYQWEVGARLMQGKILYTWKTDAEISYSDFKFDDNTGWLPNNGYTSNWQSWMWKRHAGMEVVCWDGTGANNTLNHSLGKTPEMIWAKARSESQSWIVYHKGLNGGTTPWNWYVTLDGNGAEANWAAWVQAPTSTHFSIISNWSSNSQNYIAMLFASVDGISKVGSYTGNGSTTGTSVTTGFTVRFLIIKSTSSDSWMVIDTLREFTSTDSKYLQLNSNGAQEDITLVKQITNGFQLSSTFSGVNGSGTEYIYYAHA